VLSAYQLEASRCQALGLVVLGKADARRRRFAPITFGQAAVSDPGSAPDPSGFSVEKWLSDSGYSYDPNDPFASLYPVIAARNRGSCPHPGDSKRHDWDKWAEACLRARGFCCGSQDTWCGAAQSCSGGTSASGAGTAEQIAGSAAAVAGGIAAPFTFGLSTLVAPLIGLFTSDARKNAQETQNIENVVGPACATIRSLDAAVKSGQYTAQQALTSLQIAVGAWRNALPTIFTDTTCSASEMIRNVLSAHLDFATQVYPLWAQQAQAAAAAAPVSASGSVLTIPQAQASAASALPSWWPIAALVLLGFVVIEAF
jgi:hypothetical protein